MMKNIDKHTRLVNEVLNLDITENSFSIGTIYPKDSDDIVVEIMERYFYHIKNIYDVTMKEFEGDKKYIDSTFFYTTEADIKKRFFPTFNQYKKIFKKNINIRDDYFSELKWYPTMDYQVDSFVAQREPTIKDYYQLIERYAPYTVTSLLKSEIDIYINYAYLEKSMYISGKAGSGKTETLKTIIMANIKNNKSSEIIIDIHGDYSLEIAQTIEDKDRLIFIDLFASDGYMPSLNPFEIDDRKDENLISIATQNIMGTLKAILDSEMTKIMEALIAPMINTLLRLENSTIYDLYKFCDDNLNKELVEFGIKNCDAMNSHYLKYDFYNADNRTKRALKTRLQLLLNHPKFTQFLTGKSTFNLQEAMNSNKIIIFIFNKVKLRETLSPIARFIISSMQTYAMLREDVSKEERATTYAYVDEFQNMLSEDIDEILSESRKFKLYMVMAHQFLGQIQNPRLKDSILTNTQIKITGMNAYAHNQAMSKQFGVKIEDLETIEKVGEFYFRKNNDKAFKFKSSTALLDKGISDVDKYLWKSELKKQINKYYRKVSKKDNLFTPIPKEERDYYSKDKTEQLKQEISSNQNDELLSF